MKSTQAQQRSHRQKHLLRELLRSNWRGVAETIAMMLGLTLASGLLLPLMQTFWTFALVQMTSLLGAENPGVGLVPVFQGQWERLQVPTLHYLFPAPNHHDWLINLGGATVTFLLAGLAPALLRVPLRLLSVLHVFCVVLGGLGTQVATDIAPHAKSLATLTLCLILLMPLLLALTHSIIEPRAPHRAWVCALCSGYLAFSLPFKLIGHMVLLDLLGPLAMPTLFLLFGPALDLLAVVAIYAWALSWQQEAV